MKIREIAPAKINLYLDILGKRNDGFHDIETLMQSITLSDFIEIEYFDDGLAEVSLNIIGSDDILADESNLVVRAVRAFQRRIPFSGSLRITLEKNIPVSAGLAGGSSDAAATLRALNKIFNDPLSSTELCNIASNLGSDVPFCLFGGAALCYGRGEKLIPIKNLEQLYLVIVKTKESVSTPEAYKLLDETYGDFKLPRFEDGREEILEKIKNGNVNQLYNIFQAPIFIKCTGAKKALEKLYSLGAKTVLMSGSGPTVFGMFENKLSAENVIFTMKNDVDFVCYAESKDAIL